MLKLQNHKSHFPQSNCKTRHYLLSKHMKCVEILQRKMKLWEILNTLHIDKSKHKKNAWCMFGGMLLQDNRL